MSLRLPVLWALWPFLAPLRRVEGFRLRHTTGTARYDTWPFRKIGELVAWFGGHDAHFLAGCRLLRLFEVDALAHRQALQLAAQTIEAHFHRAQTHPVAATDDSAAP